MFGYVGSQKVSPAVLKRQEVSSASRRRERPAQPPPILVNQAWPCIPLEHDLVSSAAAALRRRPASELRVLTWNVWFDSRDQLVRRDALVRQLVAAAPDVVGLQEVVPEFAASLRACEPLRSLYDISPQDVGRYGVMVLVRRELNASFSTQELPTAMGRTAVLATLGSRMPGVVVASTHLESLANAHIRRSQLQQIATSLRAASPAAVLCGDFNFDASQNYGDWCRAGKRREALENAVLKELMPDFTDAWPEVRSEKGFTFDGVVNPINVRDGQERMRYDRVMATRTAFRVTAAEMLGTEAINDWDLRPSDHFGLLVDLQVLEASSA